MDEQRQQTDKTATQTFAIAEPSQVVNSHDEFQYQQRRSLVDFKDLREEYSPRSNNVLLNFTALEDDNEGNKNLEDLPFEDDMDDSAIGMMISNWTLTHDLEDGWEAEAQTILERYQKVKAVGPLAEIESKYMADNFHGGSMSVMQYNDLIRTPTRTNQRSTIHSMVPSVSSNLAGEESTSVTGNLVVSHQEDHPGYPMRDFEPLPIDPIPATYFQARPSNFENLSFAPMDTVVVGDASLDLVAPPIPCLSVSTAAESKGQAQHQLLVSSSDNQEEYQASITQGGLYDQLDESDDGTKPDAQETSSSSSLSTSQSVQSTPKTKRIRKRCNQPNCGKRARSHGHCIAHGGGKRCAVEGCNKSSQGGDLCIKHGGGRRCRFVNCDKAAQTHSLCKAHGGGLRCQAENCNKSSQGGGFCRSHGGGKRCLAEGCGKGTQRGDFCALHGGARFCDVEGCMRNDRGGGLCAFHGGGKRCDVLSCSRPSRRNGLCSAHLRLLSHTFNN